MLKTPQIWQQSCIACCCVSALLSLEGQWLPATLAVHAGTLMPSTDLTIFFVSCLELCVKSAHMCESIFLISLPLSTSYCACHWLLRSGVEFSLSLHLVSRFILELELRQIVHVWSRRSPSPSPPSQQQREQHAHQSVKEQASLSGSSNQTHTADAHGVLSPEASSLAR